jgi:murein DD-endopeptidase MepM/ murein hydrolase activator NlpD
MSERFWPLTADRVITSPFGPRGGGFHTGCDMAFQGDTVNRPVYACAGGTVQYAGEAQGYGGPDPAGWLVIDHPGEDGGGCTEYGHIVREVDAGQRVEAGQRIAHINGDPNTNGSTPDYQMAPHLHLAVMPAAYDPNGKIDPVAWLEGARDPASLPEPGDTEPSPL